MIFSGQPNSKRGALLFRAKDPSTTSIKKRVKGRSFKLRFQRLNTLGKPLKILAFFVISIGLSYLAIVQLKQLFFNTSYFEIKKIEVTGLQSLSRAAILKLANVAPAMNLLRLDLGEIRRRLLLHPVIREANIELSGLYTLRIKIEERTPLMYIKGDTAFLEVSADGTILSHDSFGENDLPIITGLTLSGKKAGDSIAHHDGFIFARSWVQTLGEDILKGISELNLKNPSNPYIFLLSGEKVIPKNMFDFRDRYGFLCALLNNLKKNKVDPEYFDMRMASEIVVKPKTIRNSFKGGSNHLVGG